MARKKASSDVTLEEELSRVGELGKHYTGEHFLEDSGFVVMGESGDNDLCFITVMFRVGGKAWGVEDAVLKQTSFLCVPKDKRGKIHDNDFIGCRTDPIRRFDDFEVVQEPGRVVWHAGEQENIYRPPYWESKGQHLGVKWDLTMGGLGNASRMWSDLPTTGRAGFEQPLWFEGTISAGGNDYRLDSGFGAHEKVVLGDSWMQGKKLARSTRHYWIWSLNEQTLLYAYVKEATGVALGHARVEGHDTHYGSNQVVVDEMEFWDDPRTWMRVPVRWHVNMASDEGVVEMRIAASARFIYNYLQTAGHMTYYGFLCHADGRVFQKDGRTVEFKDMVTYVECGIRVMPLGIG